MPKKLILFLGIFVATILIIIFISRFSGFKHFLTNRLDVKGASISPKPIETIVNGKKRVKYSQDYTIVLLGDSMTERIGNSDELRANLKNYYPNKTFEVLNYGFGSTNILSVQKRLESETFFGRAFRPITEIDFDLILVESFGHNPLSEFPLQEGLQKQTEALDNIVRIIKENNIHAKIVFFGTIAPSKKHYSEGLTDLAPEVREKWAVERINYIQNHMNYAKTHNIPYIDILSKSLNSDGDVNLDYISNDYIHPSPKGIYLISDEIANFIFENHIF